MKKFIPIGIIATVLVLASFLCWRHFSSFSDEAIRKNLPGTWVGSSPSSGSFVIQPDGSYVADFADASGKVATTHEGTFQVADRYLIISVTKSSRTNQPVPHDFLYRIIRADAATIVLDDGDILRKDTK